MKKIILILFAICTAQISTLYGQGCDSGAPGEADSTKTAIKIFGYIQPEYQYTMSDPEVSTFTFRRARIGVRGKVLNDFTYYFMVEASPFIGGDGDGDAYLMDAFVGWEKYNWARAAIGSFKTPFGLDVLTPCNALVTIDRSIVADQLVSPQRDYGITVLGGNQYNRFNYQVALMNGSGLLVKDNNTKKDIITRATYKIFQNFQVGGSFRYGYPTPNNDEETRTSYGFDVLTNFKNFYFQGEYMYDEGAYNRAAGGGCGSTPVELGEKRDGAYGMIWYETKWNVDPVFKYEFFDPNHDVKEIGYQERMTIGLNYFFNEHVRFQLNYQANIETYINQDNDRLLAQIQIRF